MDRCVPDMQGAGAGLGIRGGGYDDAMVFTIDPLILYLL